MKKARKFYYGDLVAIVDERYEKHINHHGIIKGTIIHTQDKYTSYEVECECGDLLHPKPSDLILVLERYVTTQESPIDQNRRRFLSKLDVTPEEDMYQQVSDIIRTLPDRYKQLIIERYGLDTQEPVTKTSEAIGTSMGISRQRSHQIEKIAIEKIRTLIRK